MPQWTNTTRDNRHTLSTSTNEVNPIHIRKIVEAVVDKAMQQLEHSINDDSLYLLFEWSPISATLSITVTDATKTQDSPDVVQCTFSSPTNQTAQDIDKTPSEFADDLHFWLHDYLTTCTAFFRYSLVAIFTSTSRNNTHLL